MKTRDVDGMVRRRDDLGPFVKESAGQVSRPGKSLVCIRHGRDGGFGTDHEWHADAW